MSDETADPIQNEIQPYLPPAAPPPALVPPRPLSAWGAFGYSLLIFLIYSAIQAIAGAVFLGIQAAVQLNSPGRPPAPRMDPGAIGSALGAGTLIAVPVGVWITILYTRMRSGVPAREYLGLRWPTWRQAAPWTIALVAVTAAYDFLGRWLERPAIPEFMRDLLAGVDSPATIAVLWLAVILAAPFFEEILFRGFFFEGLRRSRLGVPGAVVLPSLIFASIHLQYDLFDMGAVLVLGVLLALARWQTGSTWLTIALHAFHNGVSMIWTAWALQG